MYSVISRQPCATQSSLKDMNWCVFLKTDELANMNSKKDYNVTILDDNSLQ